jgi:hypothetical protein
MSTTQEIVNDHPSKNLKSQRKRKPMRFYDGDQDEHGWEMDYDRYERRSRKSRRNNDREFDYN